MRCKSVVLGMVLCAAVAGCATSQQVAEVVKQDYGPPPPESWKSNVRDWFEVKLKDSDTAMFRMGCPVKGYVKNAVFSGAGSGFEFVGYLARVEVNGKNSYGGYSGFTSYIAFIARTGEVVNVINPISGGWDHPRVHVIEAKPCEEPVRVRFQN